MEEEEKESTRGGLDAWGCEGAVCDSSEGLAGTTREGESLCGSVCRVILLTGAPGRSGEVSFNLDIALPRLVDGDEIEEPGRSKESA